MLTFVAPQGKRLLAAPARRWKERSCRWPQLLRWLAVGFVCLYALTVLTVGGSAVARPMLRGLTAGWVIVVMTLILWRWQPKEILRRCLRLLDLAATNLVLCLVLGEMMLRGYAAWTGDSLLVREGMEARRLAPHRNYGDLLRTNAQGYASREFIQEKKPGVKRIALLGDSFAVGTVRQEKNFVSQLELLRPDIEVYNFGVSGIGPREYCAILQREVWQYEPDLVLVCFFVGNDVTGWLPIPRTKNLAPEGHCLYLFVQRSWRLVRERYRREKDETRNELLRQPLGFPPLSRLTHLQVEAEALKICQPSQKAAMEKNWLRSLGYMDQIIAAGQVRKTPVAGVLIPDELAVNPGLLAEVMEYAQVLPGDLDLELPQRRLRAYCAERAVPCLDLKPAFEGQAGMYRPRDTHWNERGNRLAAERIARWLD